jgi:hypothetical protein
MRQAGVIAAAGIVALESMVNRLHEDHKRANAIGKGEECMTATMKQSSSEANGCLASHDIPYVLCGSLQYSRQATSDSYAQHDELRPRSLALLCKQMFQYHARSGGCHSHGAEVSIFLGCDSLLLG